MNYVVAVMVMVVRGNSREEEINEVGFSCENDNNW